MASYIAVPRDLTKVKSKVVFNLTKRQLICFSLAALIGVPSFFLFRHFGSTSMATMGMMVIMMPLFFFAMYEKNGEPLEIIMIHFIQANFIRPKIRRYQTNNYYTVLMRQADLEQEVESIVGKYKKDDASTGKKKDSHAGASKQRRPEKDKITY